MKKINKIIVLSFVLCLGFLISCTQDKGITKLKSSTRRVYSDMKYLENSASGFLKKLNKNETKEVLDTSNYQLSTIKQKNFINEFSYLYDAINGGTTNNYLSNLDFDVERQLYIKNQTNKKTIRKDKEVYTWYPYWMGDVWQSYNFDLLTTVSFFAYKIDPSTGGYLNPDQISQWRQTALIDTAKAHNTKILLTLALEGEDNQNEFLKNETSWNVLLDSVTVLLKDRDADGIEIDFTKVSKDNSLKFSRMVSNLKDNLEYRFISKKIFVAVVLPPNPQDFLVDLITLDEYVDIYIVKGTDYHEIDYSNPSVAPLRSDLSDGLSLENTLIDYLKKGLVPQKSILALPLYGTQWGGSWKAQNGYYETDFQKKVTLAEVNRLFASRDTTVIMNPNLDEVSLTNYFLLEFPDDTSIECWFDDHKTLSTKMDLALSREFMGIGLWALGYDLGMTEVWQVIEEKFTGDEIIIKDPIAEIDGYPIQYGAFIEKYQTLFVVTFCVVTMGLFVVLVIAFSDWRFRETIAVKQLYRIMFLMLCVIALLPTLSYFGLLQGGNWIFIVVFFLGALASYFIQKYGGMIKVNKP
jgi:spore germination protein YaaH